MREKVTWFGSGLGELEFLRSLSLAATDSGSGSDSVSATVAATDSDSVAATDSVASLGHCCGLPFCKVLSSPDGLKGTRARAPLNSPRFSQLSVVLR